MDQVDLLVMCRVRGVSWNFLAREAQRPDGMERLRAGRAAEESPEASKSLAALAAARDDLGERQRIVEGLLEGTETDGIQLTTVLDEDYPVNLRTIFNLPPFLFYLGTLRPDDALSVVVVGTRQASADGLSRTKRMAGLLVDAGVTVLSGLARGIDTTAHQACLDAGGTPSPSWAPASAASTRPRTRPWPSRSPSTAPSSRSSGPTPIRRRTRSRGGTW